jgi:hypothetical protein
MANPHFSPSEWEDLLRQVTGLERRVRMLEQRLGETRDAPPAAPEPIPIAARESAALHAPPPFSETANALPVLGTALLGIAGAYLLRALAEFGTLPRSAGVLLGVLYAILWLYLAARTAAERKLQVVIYGLTSVLVLIPMIWETTIRFKTMPPWAAAVTLTLFSAAGLALSWRKNIVSIAWITTLSGLAAAFALLIATKDVIPFTLALLTIAAVVEFSACWDHWLGERWVVALAADFSAFFVAFLVTRRTGLPEGYIPISLGTALFVQGALLAVYLGSTAGRTLLRNLSFTPFETVQTVVAFLVALSGALRIVAGKPAAAAAIGSTALLGGVFCYVVAFVFLERRKLNSRNLYTYSTYGLLLVLAGSGLMLSGVPLALAGACLATICLWIGARARRTTVRWHGTLYLALTSLASGLIAQSATALFAPAATAAFFDSPAWLCALAVFACYAIIVSARPEPDMKWADHVPALVVGALAAWTAAGFVSMALLFALHLGTGGAGSPAVAATLRTGALTLLAIAICWAGRRWTRLNISWLVPVFMLVAGYRLLAHDLRHGHTATLFVSMLLYGGALVLLPRMLKKPAAS